MSRPQTWRPLFFTAGISSIAFVLLLIAALVVDFLAPPPVHGGTATLEFIAQNKALYIVEQVLWILPNILAVLVFVTLFVALKPLGQSLVLIATVFGCTSMGALPRDPGHQSRRTTARVSERPIRGGERGRAGTVLRGGGGHHR